MSAPQPDFRVALSAAILLTLLGVAGIANGHQEYSGATVPLPDAGASDAQRIVGEVSQAISRSPARRPLGAANMLVSAMLLVGSLALTYRRKWSIWFIRQAIVANVLWIIASCVADVHRMTQLGELMVRLAVASGQQGLRGENALAEFVLARVSIAFAVILFHGFVGWRASRPAVRAFVTPET